MAAAALSMLVLYGHSLLAAALMTPAGAEMLSTVSAERKSLMRSERKSVVRSEKRSPARLQESGCSTCIPLKNHGSHFTAEVSLGTPAQTFQLVADTGSDSLLVSSCICKERGDCNKDDHCLSTRTSSSLQIQWKNRERNEPEEMVLTFGSGPIRGALAKDNATVGTCSVDMQDGLLLMVKTALDVMDPITGILGLGLPQVAQKRPKRQPRGHGHGHGAEGGQAGEWGNHGTIQDIIDRIKGKMGGGAEGQGGIIGASDSSGIFGPSLIVSAGGYGSSDEDILRALLGDPSHASLLDRGELPFLSEAQMQQVLRSIRTPPHPSEPYLSSEEGIARESEPELQFLSEAQLQQALRSIRTLPQPSDSDSPYSEEGIEPELQLSSFLDQAKISHFSICFNDGKEGKLMFQPTELPQALATVGKEHWGLDFRGISIGGAKGETKPLKKMSFCLEENMTKGQHTPCGIIPDSGTTMMMGPKLAVAELLSSICDGWARCSENHTAFEHAAEEAAAVVEKRLNTTSPWEFPVPSKAAILKYVLMDCDSWMGESETDGGLHELPELQLHVRSSTGDREEALTFHGADYVFETYSTKEQEDATVSEKEVSKYWASYFEEAHAVGSFLERLSAKDVPKDAGAPAEAKAKPEEADVKQKDAPKDAGAVAEATPKLEVPIASNVAKPEEAGDVAKSDATDTARVEGAEGDTGKASTKEASKKKRVCMPAFGSMEYPTQKNGDVWIAGLPLFYTHEVHYGTQTTPPTVGFQSFQSEGHPGCGTCGGEKQTETKAKEVGVKLLSTSQVELGSPLPKRRRQPRRIYGKPRLPQFDTSLSL